MVRVYVRTALPARGCVLQDLPATMGVAALRSLIAQETSQPLERLKLVFKGRALLDSHGDQPAFVKFSDEDSLIAVVIPKAPPKHIQNPDGLEDDEELRFQLPETATHFQRQLINFLRGKLKVPDIVLILVFSLSLRTWILLAGWFVMARLAYRWDLGPLYILATAFALIFWNLGKRQEGEFSAYSIFNEGFRELPGTLNADRLDQDLRAGRL